MRESAYFLFDFFKFILKKLLNDFFKLFVFLFFTKVFMDSYKSPLSMIVIDDIERILERTSAWRGRLRVVETMSG